MSDDLIRYDVLAQEALRGVVRKVLQEISQTGLPGEHHFFITFDPNNPGVKLSSRLRALYPDEMTIVLQHQFWDLNVTDTGIEVGLSFNGIPERMQVPYRAITAFVDPHASFGLKFDAGDDSALEAGIDIHPVDDLQSPDAATEFAGGDKDASEIEGDNVAIMPDPRRITRAGDIAGEELVAAENDDEAGADESGSDDDREDEITAETGEDGEGEDSGQSEESGESDDTPPDEGAQVVSLDAFRKKNG